MGARIIHMAHVADSSSVISSCRHGAFSNACEEWAEAKILACFLLGGEGGEVQRQVPSPDASSSAVQEQQKQQQQPEQGQDTTATGPQGLVVPSSSKAAGQILPWSQVSWLLTVEEYLGGLYDFTGELGRLAVVKATERDLIGVTSYLDLLDDLEARLMQLDPG